MRINAKGLHWTVAKLADGTTKKYWYAWRGGPRLRGEPGSPEFIADFNAAAAMKVPAPEGRLLALLQAYQRSQEFLRRRDRTRSDYKEQIEKIEPRFGDCPLKAMSDPRTRGVFLDWRDELALKSPRQADYALSVLALVLAWGKGRGKIATNPLERIGRVYDGTRIDFVWSTEDEARFLQHAPARLHLALLMGLWTGQRQGDLLRLPWSAYDGTHPLAPVEDRSACGDQGWRAVKGGARCDTKALADHPNKQSRQALDGARIPRLVAARVHRGRYR